ncbi:20225_t:CDS:2 [Gigaspora margarita]|uniref:20225_t:CDS:1 n=1 Tax=Gigaspora margarita TaxID=4874 RepID=A0ABN7W8Q5_GIGMA|nr:20225_t:CDS:2 [Gigaspora margarita]
MLSEFAKKVQQYFEKDPSIYIEKIKEEYKGTIAEWQTKYFNLLPKWQINETEVKKLREENDKLKKERDLYKTSETNLGTKLAKFVGSASKEAITRANKLEEESDLPENYALMEEGFKEKKTLLASQKVADLTELGDKIQRLGTEKDKN